MSLLWLLPACDSTNQCEIICVKLRACDLPTADHTMLADVTCSADWESALCKMDFEGTTDMDPATPKGQAACVADRVLALAHLHVWIDGSFPEDLRDIDFCHAIDVVARGEISRSTDALYTGVCHFGEGTDNACERIYGELINQCKLKLPPKS